MDRMTTDTAKRAPTPTPASCGGCSRTWLSLAACHCTICHAHFSSVKGFDLHWRNGQHRRPEDVRGRDGYRLLKLTEQKIDGAVWVCDSSPHVQVA